MVRRLSKTDENREIAEAAKAETPEPVDRIVRSARACFARLGVRKTSMAEVARAAGVVRQTVYDYVASREHLIQLALTARLYELAADLATNGSLAKAPLVKEMTERLALMAEAVRDDPECTRLFDALSYQQAVQFITAHEAVQQMVMVTLKPLYDRARREKRLRANLTLEEMGWWTRSALLPLPSRRDLDPAQIRAIVKKFILPAFVTAGDT